MNEYNALISDTHFGARNDSQIYYTHMENFFKNIFWKEIDKHKVKTIFHLGDFFDRRKFINYKTLDLAYRIFLNEAIKRDITCYFIIGNHDTYYKNSSELNSLQLIISKGNYDKFHIIQDKPEIVVVGKDEIKLIPWINEDNYNIIVNEYLKKWNSGILFGHFEISGFDMGGTINCSGMPVSLFKNFKVYTGHFHRKQSFGNITYIGSPLQFTWNDYNSEKGFYIFSDINNIKFIKNPIDIFKLIEYREDQINRNVLLSADYSQYNNLYIKVIVKNKTDQLLFDMFLEKLNESNPYEVKVIDQVDLENLDSTDIDNIDESKSTLEIIQKYILELNLKNGNEISKIITDLYNYANYMDME